MGKRVIQKSTNIRQNREKKNVAYLNRKNMSGNSFELTVQILLI